MHHSAPNSKYLVRSITAGLMWAPLILAVMYTITDSVQPFPIALLSEEFVVPAQHNGHLKMPSQTL